MLPSYKKEQETKQKRQLRNTTNIMQIDPQLLRINKISNYISLYFKQRSHFESDK